MDGMLCIFPKMCNYSCVRTPPFCGLEGALHTNFVPQQFPRTVLQLLFGICLLKDKNPSSTNVFSTASVFFHSCISDKNNPQEGFLEG